MKYPDNICDEVPLQNVKIFESSLCLKYHHGSSIWHIDCVMITDVLLQIWTVAYLLIIMNSHVSCLGKGCNGAHLPQFNNVIKLKILIESFSDV